MTDTRDSFPEPVDILISGATIVTMDMERRIISDGALAIRGDHIAAVGKRHDIERRYHGDERIDGRRFVITPGCIDAHIHITGDPLTRGYIPDDIDDEFGDKLSRWVTPRFLAHSPDDERLSAQFAAVQMLRSGTTCFLEAGTIQYLDAVVDGLGATGIRGRVGVWIEGRTHDVSENETAATDRAIRLLQDEVGRYPADSGANICAWPILVGHATNTDEVWTAAKSLADEYGLGVSAHMVPYQDDVNWYLEHVGRRPIEHLAELGVLGENVCLTHVVHIDSGDVALLAETQTNTILCPLAGLRGAFGLSPVSRFPEMSAAGINIALGTDGDFPDLLEKFRLVAGIFKDARQDITIFPAHETLAMGWPNGARALQLQDEIGALEPGKKADFVFHDTDHPVWRPVLNPLHQLAWSADGRSIHSVWVNGIRVVENYRCTLIDEDALYEEVQTAGEAIVARSGVPSLSAWPIE